MPERERKTERRGGGERKIARDGERPTKRDIF